MRRQDPYYALHEGISELIQETALYPPKDEGMGYDILNIVRIIPDVSGREMIHPLRVDLRKVLRQDEKKELERRIPRNGKSLPNKRLSSTSMWSTHGSMALEALGTPSLSASRSSSKSSVRDLKITGAKRCALQEGSEEYIQKIMNRYLAKFIPDKNFSEAIRGRFMIGVITSVITGELKVFSKRESSKSKKLKAGMDDVGVGTEYSTAKNANISSVGRGILGVGLICFLVECDPNNCTYTLSRGVRVVPGMDDLFPQCLSFIAGERRGLELFRSSNRRDWLFAGSTIVNDSNSHLDSKGRKEFRRITKEFGKRPSVLGAAKQILRESGLGHIITGLKFLKGYLRGDFVNRRTLLIKSSQNRIGR